MKRLYFDSETCGLHGVAVLFQHAVEDGPIELYDVWRRPVWETLELIEWYCEHAVVGFNLTFDWFHVAKIYTLFKLCPSDSIPAEHVDEIAELERAAMDGPCVKPASALDLMLHSRKGPFQSLMRRNPVRIRRVPRALAYPLALELSERLELDDIYFARSKSNGPRWKALDRKRQDGTICPEFQDVVLSFNPAGGLKFLAEYALGKKPRFHFKDVEVAGEHLPTDLGYAPFANAVSSRAEGWKTEKGHAWPGVIHHHIDHWANNADAREYARDDIVYTRDLCHYFDDPEPGDNDSVLACMVGAVRWHGYELDLPGIRELADHAQEVIDASPVNVNKPNDVRDYICGKLDTTEGLLGKSIIDELNREDLGVFDEVESLLAESTKKSNVIRIIEQWEGHPAAKRAKEILEIKGAIKERDVYRKLLKAGRLHADFNIIGAKSSRMSGSGGLNAQGIQSDKRVRAKFPLAWDGYQLCGGDFSSFEITLLHARTRDRRLDEILNGTEKLHALFGTVLFPGNTYADIMATDGLKGDLDLYKRAKGGVFAEAYFGDAGTLSRNIGIPMEDAEAAHAWFLNEFSEFGQWRDSIEKRFQPVQQSGGIGTAIHWREPDDFVESFLGFRRYFTLENKVCQVLFDLAQKPPKAWRNVDVYVMRDTHRQRIQTAAGAVASALYGAVFGLGGSNVRAAGNHEIQSPGGLICKHVERAIWDIQPAGVHEWRVAPMNVHDEIPTVAHPDYISDVTRAVHETVESYRSRVPLIGIDWCEDASDWANMKGK